MLYLTASFSAHAQKYNFRTYSLAEGLPQSQAYALCEDKRGNLWIGTRGGGVSCFDGKNFTNYTEQDGLINNYVRAIIQDRDGNIWIGTDEGISKYDGKTFTSYTKLNGLPDNAVNAIIQDRKGTIWFCTDKGGFCKMVKNGFKVFSKVDGLINDHVICAIEDIQGDLWIGTENGVSRMRNDQIINNYTTKSGLCSNILRGMAIDRSGMIWFATYTGGICKYDGSGFTSYRAKDGLASNAVLSILCDNQGNIWCGTTCCGVSRFDGKKFTTFTENEGLCNNNISALLQDMEGNIWLGSSGGGICRFDNERFINFMEKPTLLGSVVYSFLEDSSKNIWMGSSIGGVTVYNGNSYTRYSEKDGFTAQKVRCIFRDSKSRIWFGTLGDGIYIYDGRKFTHPASKSSFIVGITEDKTRTIWFATLGGGVSYYSEKESRIMRPRIQPAQNRVFSIYTDKNNTLWLGTSGGGLCKFQHPLDSDAAMVTYTTQNGMSSNIIRSIVADKAGNLWLGSGGGGIMRYDGKIFKSYTGKNGLASNNIYLLQFDKGDNLWVGTEKGMDRISFTDPGNSKIKSIHHFGRPEGFNGIETIQNASMEDSKGRLWFGTVNGTACFDPGKDEANKSAPQTHLTGIRLFFSNIAETPYGKHLSAWYKLPASLTLPYNKNHLSFSFVGINLHNPERVRYKWILEGFDNDWSPANEQTQATYSSLPPGNYIFKVKSCNEDGVWNASPQTFNFEITPPFWATWWFRTLGIFVIASLLYLFYSLRIRQIKRKDLAERNKLETERNIAQMEQQALLLQMNPHFIFNALNSIQGFISTKETSEAKRYLAKFGKLMRQTLENSRESQVVLEDEISMLTNYLDLEKLCQSDKFEYSITVSDNLDASQVSIPPMLIQPFVENAILHGIKPSPEKGTISINFSQGESGFIICEIRDNGVGLNASLALKNDSSTEHKSAAYEITKKRLNMMDESDKKPNVFISDLSEEGMRGTKVELRIPLL